MDKMYFNATTLIKKLCEPLRHSKMANVFKNITDKNEEYKNISYVSFVD